MATYASVVSVMHLMDQIQLYHARKPIFSDKQQRQLDSLSKKVSFLQDFLENYDIGDSDEAESLESRIVDLFCSVEDIIESYIVDHIRGGSRKNVTKKRGKKTEKKLIKFGRYTIGTELIANKFSQDVQNVIELIDTIKRELMEIKGSNKVFSEQYTKGHEQGSLGFLNLEKDNVVGLDGILNSIMEKLTARQSELQVIAVTGMGGSGKSTLAKKVYDARFTKEHFDIFGWVTISQEFNAKQVLSELLCETGGPTIQAGNEDIGYHHLGEQLYKHLSGRRFFVILDDIWSLEAWERIKLFLPDYNNGSRVMVTTRLSNLADDIGPSHTYKMKLLDEGQSWSLLCRKVFGQESCPIELEDIGRVVANNCKGLPLSIVVLGGLLRKSIMREYWEYIAEDINSNVILDENERCLKILYMSYYHLPIHLKPCFLYLGVFPEDHEIRVTELIKIWVAERFLKPNKAKSLEEVAFDYLKDLIDRNLIFVSKLGSTGKVKRCKFHDLLRDFCIRESTKKRFVHVSKVLESDTSQGFNCRRRLALCGEMPYKERYSLGFHALRSSSYIRSFICDFQLDLLPFDVKLLSVLKLGNGYFPEVISELGNSRYLDFTSDDFDRNYPPFSSLVCRLWNLQTLILRLVGTSLPSEFWEMSQLRHVIMGESTIEDPCSGNSNREDNVVLENLQTFSEIRNFKCSEEVVQKIPNIKKLSIVYQEINFPSKCLKNLGRLTELESLSCFIDYNISMDFSLSALEFSSSLKKLKLGVNDWDWENIGEKVGLLPHLEKFTLYYSYGGEVWNSVEGRFPRLKYLFISGNLACWTADSTSFPCLEHLHLWNAKKLEEIPSEIGEIPTLRSIKVSHASDSAIASAKMILEEQRSFGNNDLLVTIGKKLL